MEKNTVTEENISAHRSVAFGAISGQEIQASVCVQCVCVYEEFSSRKIQ